MNTIAVVGLAIPAGIGSIVLGCLLGWSLMKFAHWMDHR